MPGAEVPGEASRARRVAGLLAATVASAVLCGVYARGGAGWAAGFVALAPWLIALDGARSTGGAVLCAWAMSVLYTAAVFPWFGGAVGRYTGLGHAAGMALLLVAAPLFQPQFLALALARRLFRRHHGPAVAALAGVAAWAATERLMPRLLDDTMAYGLHVQPLLAQAADLVGAAGLTVLLLLCGEALAAAWRLRAGGVAASARALAAATAVPLVLAGYGLWTASQAAGAADGELLRVGLVQSNIVDYERLRQERGSGAVVREVLDVHYAMTYDAVERQGAQAVLWSETVYPTTFGQPRSEAGAELDREIQEIVNAAGVPFVFGAYERDAAGEYNAAVFLAPDSGVVGRYRKTRLFPLTEHVPAWLEGPLLRRWLPWAGTWQPGDGARVLPLRLADGREVPVLPLVCLDAMDAGLVAAGARLGAQAILAMSNDSWFSDDALGARLHLAAAAMRSIETRLPQFRVTPSGYSAVIDARGEVRAASHWGERMLVVGSLPVGEPRRTLAVAWGDWVGLVAAAGLALLGALGGWRAWRGRVTPPQAEVPPPGLPKRVAALPSAARWAAGGLRLVARASLLTIAAAFVLGDDGLRTNTMQLLRSFAVLVLAPEAAAWFVLRAWAARLSIKGGALVLARGARRLEVALPDVAAVEPWRIPLPCEGAWLRMKSGERWPLALAGCDPLALARALAAGGAAEPTEPTGSGLALALLRNRLAWRPGVLGSAWMRLGVLPLVIAVPAFRLHQQIAYGSPIGEYLSFGLGAYASGFALWWASWAVGVAACAAALRAAVEATMLVVVLAAPARAVPVRLALERAALALLYLGIPGWLAWRAWG